MLGQLTMPELLAEPVRASRRALAKAYGAPDRIPVDAGVGLTTASPIQPSVSQDH